MGSHATESVVPERGVQSEAILEVLHPRDILYGVRLVAGLGVVLDLEISEEYDPDLYLYDPESTAWITDNPWITELQLDPADPVMMRHYYLTPDFADTYAVDTVVNVEGGGTSVTRSV